MASARYVMLMLGSAKLPVARDEIKRRLCARSRDRVTQRQGSSVDAVMVRKVIPLPSPTERKRAGELEPLTLGLHLPAKADRDERIYGAERVVRDDESKVLERVAIRIVAPTNGAPELRIFQSCVAQ